MKTIMIRALRLLLAGILLLTAAGCAPMKPAVTKSAQNVTPAVTVLAVDNRYEPATVKIKTGQAVRWQFRGSAKHDVVETATGLFVSELVREGEFTHVFKKPGVYKYVCSIHPEMRGVIEVVAD